jgi:hypothetical protein
MKKATPAVQEKFMIAVRNGESFGPYDTHEAADKTRAALIAARITTDKSAKVVVLMTCRTAATRLAEAVKAATANAAASA